MQALPSSIDTPLDFEWEVLQQVEDPFMGQALDAAGWLTQDAYPRLDPGAIGNASREEFEWAHQVRFCGLTSLCRRWKPQGLNALLVHGICLGFVEMHAFYPSK